MTPEDLRAIVQSKVPDVQAIAKLPGQARGEELYLSVPPAKILDVCRLLRSDDALSFDFLSFVTAVDFKTYFEVVYYAVSTRLKHKIVLKARLNDRAAAEIQSVTSIWAAADWQEREIFDLMGIRFTGHYNLRRILLPEDWEGYPLRKDYVAKPDRYD